MDTAARRQTEARFRWSRGVAIVVLVGLCVFGSLVTMTSVGPHVNENTPAEGKDARSFGVWGSGRDRPLTGSYQPLSARDGARDGDAISVGAIEIRARLCFWVLLGLSLLFLVSYRRERSTRWSANAHVLALIAVTWCGWQYAGRIETLYGEAAQVYGIWDIEASFSPELRIVQALLLSGLLWALWPAVSAWLATWRKRGRRLLEVADTEDAGTTTG